MRDSRLKPRHGGERERDSLLPAQLFVCRVAKNLKAEMANSGFSFHIPRTKTIEEKNKEMKATNTTTEATLNFVI